MYVQDSETIPDSLVRAIDEHVFSCVRTVVAGRHFFLDKTEFTKAMKKYLSQKANMASVPYSKIERVVEMFNSDYHRYTPNLHVGVIQFVYSQYKHLINKLRGDLREVIGSCERNFYGIAKRDMKEIVEQKDGRPHLGLCDNWRYYHVLCSDSLKSR